MSSVCTVTTVTTSISNAASAAGPSENTSNVSINTTVNQVASAQFEREQRIKEFVAMDGKKLNKLLKRAKESGNIQKISEIEAAKALRNANTEKPTSQKAIPTSNSAATAASAESAKSEEVNKDSKSLVKTKAKEGPGKLAYPAATLFPAASLIGTCANKISKRFKANGITKIELLSQMAKEYNHALVLKLKSQNPNLPKPELDEKFNAELKKLFKESPALLKGTLHYATELKLPGLLNLCHEAQQEK